MAVRNQAAGFLISGAAASGAGNILDTRGHANFGYLLYMTSDDSARITLQVSHDKTGWLQHSIYTATTSSGSAQLTDYFPYVRGTVLNKYGDATAYAHYTPGLT